MGFVRLRLFGFRNLADGWVSCDSPEVYLIGDNGQGKTNFIEAVHLLCFGSSFRTRVDARMVRHGAEAASVEGRLRLPTATEIDVTVRVGRDREILVNGKPVRDRAELLANLPCIVFSHEDFDFVSGAPERKRWFLNQTLSLTDRQYLPTLRSYRRLLMARNHVAKERAEELLDPYDEQMAVVGYELQTRREAALADFSVVFSEHFDRVASFGFPVSLAYVPSWRGVRGSEDALQQLRRRRAVDLRFGTTTCGPHRDTYVFRAGERNLEAVASTGQLRLCSLMLRVAQATYYRARTGRKPILLLDDVILELDGARKRAFVENLPDRDQAFFTFLSDESYRAYRSPQTLSLSVRAGKIEPCDA
jgi:DNA replication and repair protein RecF